jgi:uncharacterized protein (DUF2147 family)
MPCRRNCSRRDGMYKGKSKIKGARNESYLKQRSLEYTGDLKVKGEWKNSN